MSSERIKGDVVFICDDCDDALETDTGDFNEANLIRREAGWTALQDRANGDWRHRCDDCASITSAFHPVD
jgi:hypothetical protein